MDKTVNVTVTTAKGSATASSALQYVLPLHSYRRNLCFENHFCEGNSPNGSIRGPGNGHKHHDAIDSREFCQQRFEFVRCQDLRATVL